MIIPVILCGGYGAHLWPLSRELYPKQVMSMMKGDLSLLQQTVMRLADFRDLTDAPIVLCNEEHRFMAAAQIQGLGVATRSIILESKARNTAPSTAVAAMEAMNGGDDPILLVLPVDHYFEDVQPLARAVRSAAGLAESGRIVAFGVTPTSPATGYGYIEKGSETPLRGSDVPAACSAFEVRSFIAGPDVDSARGFAGSGQHLWNSGIFMFKASAFLEEMKVCAPDLLQSCSQAHSLARRDLDFLRLNPEAFDACPEGSIDCVLMERTNRAVVVPLSIRWRDLGSWRDLYEIQEKDEAGNVQMGDIVSYNVQNCYLHAGSRMVAAVGISNQVVVETKDVVFIAPFDCVQDVNVIVSRLLAAGRGEAKVHSKVYRPWGTYECIDLGDRFQVKRITVNPGSKLSLQKHYHRAEHWVVVKGTARITRDSEEMLITENQSTYVPLGTVHRLENPGRIPLELIEIQTGSYLEEDDIVRFDDVYGRVRDKSATLSGDGE